MTRPLPALPALLTAEEVAPILRMKPAEVTRLCREHKLRAARPGRAWLIEPADVDAYIAKHRNQAGDAA